MYAFGMEEEYFLFDAKTTLARRRVNKDCRWLAQRRLGDRMMPEMLPPQLEVAAPPCETFAEARAYLAHYRRALGEMAAQHWLGIAAMGTFPLAYWPDQTVTPKPRYGAIIDDLQMIGYRNMLCGMHVHVAVPDVETRINLIMRLTPYLPLLLALTTSSPFWQGNLTGLVGYRLAAYDELPRTGLPELFRTNDDYREFVAALKWAKVIPDESYIWWAIRPSLRNPTIELRVADSCTRLDDALAVAALFRCLVRALDRDRALNAGFDRVGRAITQENKWHAQRYGIRATFIEPFSRSPLTLVQWLDQVIDFIAEDIDAFDCANKIRHLHSIATNGTSADRQIEIFSKALVAGRRRLTALKQVIDWVAGETQAPDHTRS